MDDEKRYDLIDGNALKKIYDGLKSRLNNIVPLVVICGPGKCEPDEECTTCEPEKKMDCVYHQRNALKTTLNDNGCLATTFEEDLELEYARAIELLGKYKFNPIELSIYGGWKSSTVSTGIPSFIDRYFGLDTAEPNINYLKMMAEIYFKKLLVR